jgi:hypothetical protein
MSTLGDPFGAFLDAVADRVAVRLALGARPQAFDSEHLPPRTTRRRFIEMCRSGRVPGAWREGRLWVCTCSDWETTRTPRPISVASPLPNDPISAKADALLARARLRVVKGAP